MPGDALFLLRLCSWWTQFPASCFPWGLEGDAHSQDRDENKRKWLLASHDELETKIKNTATILTGEFEKANFRSPPEFILAGSYSQSPDGILPTVF